MILFSTKESIPKFPINKPYSLAKSTSVPSTTAKRCSSMASTPPTGSLNETRNSHTPNVRMNHNSKVLATPNRIASPRMREEDADLLESMHYASSQVSQYTPDGTPLLRPKDRSLPMENVKLISMPIASTSDLLMKKDQF